MIEIILTINKKIKMINQKILKIKIQKEKKLSIII